MFITFKHKQNKLPVKKINSLLQSFPRKPGKLKETENNWREKKSQPQEPSAPYPHFKNHYNGIAIKN